MSRLTLIFALTLVFISPFASADIPHLISLQGKLTDASDNPVSSSTNFAFRIYDVPTGGTALWTEFQTIAPDTLGIFSALLGSVTALNIPFNESYWLEVQVNSEILSPRTRMGSAGYALRSESPWNATGNDIYTTNAGNVGIGTATPAQKLTVSGDVSWTGNLLGGSVPWARLSNIPNYAGSSSQGGPATTATALASNGANCAAGQYAQGVDTSGNAEGCSAPAGGVTGSGTANYLPKWTTGTALGNSVIYDNGNVGIGTTSPGAKLEVAGTIKSTSGGFVFPDGSVQDKAGLSGNWNVANGQLVRYVNNAGSSVYHAYVNVYGAGSPGSRQIVLNQLPDTTLKIRFSMQLCGGPSTTGQIYRNGVAVGTLRSCNPGYYGTCADCGTYDEVISGWNLGDSLQVITGGSTYSSISILGTVMPTFSNQ